MNYDEVDTISPGGIPKRKLTLVVATTSSGQTESLLAGTEKDQAEGSVTFEDSADELRESTLSSNLDIAAAEAKTVMVSKCKRRIQSSTMGIFFYRLIVRVVRHSTLGAERGILSRRSGGQG